MLSIGGIDLIRCFVDVVDAVVEEPVGDEHLATALHDLVFEGSETVLLAVPGLWVLGLLPKLRQVLAEDHAEQVPAVAERGVRVLELVHHLQQRLRIPPGLQPRRQRRLLAGRLANDFQTERVKCLGVDPLGWEAQR
jgi:hypothetical protein